MGKQSYLSIPKEKHDWTLGGEETKLFISRPKIHWQTIVKL